MNEQEIIEGNKLIADFMQIPKAYYFYLYPRVHPFSAYKGPKLNLTKRILFEDLEYHLSWDWIMLVVGKISKVHSIKGVYNEYSKVDEALRMIDINILFPAVVNFIEWYNTQSIPS